MSQEFKFSDPGEGLQEAEVLEVHVSDGDQVSDGDVALTLETDKASTEIPVPFSGTIEQVNVAEGDTIEVGDVLMTYNEGEAKDSQQDAGGQDKSRSSSGQQSQQSDQTSTQQKGQGKKGQKKSQQSSQSQKSQTQDAQSQQDSDQSGGKGQQQAKQTDQKQSGSQASSDKQQPVPAAPSARRLAREKGVDLHSIEPSGQQGQVTSEDVEAAASEAESGQAQDQQPATSPLTPAIAPPEMPDFSQWGETQREPLRSIRRATAQNMAQSWAQIPHVFHEDVADITALERFRRAHEVKHGKLTVTVLMMKALVSVLKRFPRFNASLDVQNQEIVYKQYFHIGLAVATERGLLVPVIRDVDRKSITELAAEAADLAQKTRNGELSSADMSGAGITITNPGAMGGTSLTPLVNPPQVAILGMAQARLEPVVKGDLDDYKITPRLRMPLVLGFDHRVNDGADAAQFVTALIKTLADPESLLMAV